MEGQYNVRIYYNYDVGAYFDFDNYRYWTTQYINALGSFNFFGPGPQTYVPQSVARLGKTYQKKRVGKPHHLWLKSDVIGGAELVPGYATCGQVIRRMEFYVVDADNRKTGATWIREYFPNGPYTDSCSGEPAGATTTPVEIGPNEWFRDFVLTGCNQTTGGSIGGDCGFTSYPGYIQWVPRSGAPPVNLAIFHRDVRYNWVRINGWYTEFPTDAQFFP